jgi:hypothetical protein
MLQETLCMGAPINFHPYFAAKPLLHNGVASAPQWRSYFATHNFHSKVGHCNITVIYTHAFPNTVILCLCKSAQRNVRIYLPSFETRSPLIVAAGSPSLA